MNNTCKAATCICLAHAFILQISATIENTFRIRTITPITYGDGIATMTVRNKMACMIKCSVDGSCRSVTFDPAGNKCTTNRWEADISGVLCETGCTSVSTVFYAKKPLKTTMRLPCRTSADCVDPESECRQNQCLCKAGYSYHGASYACVHGCSSYGTTFQPDLNSVTMFDNQKTFQGVSSLDTCKSYCINEVSFVCKTIEFSGSTCILQDYTALDKWGIYRSNYPGWHLYTRDCA